jgi:hypothetical protein
MVFALWAWVLAAIVAQTDTQTAFGSGLSLSRAAERDSTGDFVFYVQRAGDPQATVQFKLTRAVSGIEGLYVHSEQTVSVLAALTEGLHLLNVVDAPSGQLVYAQICKDVRLTPDRSRFLCFDSPDGRSYSFELTARKKREIQTPITGAVLALAQSSPIGKRAALRTIMQVQQLRESPTVREAVRNALIQALQEDVRLASARTSGGVREGSEQRETFGALITTAAQLGDRTSIEPICRADHLAIRGALAMFGPVAVPAILGALRGVTPAGYSEHYRPALLASLGLLLENNQEIESQQKQNLIKLEKDILFHSSSWREIQEAVRLTEPLDDDELDARVDALAENPNAIRALHVDEWQSVGEIQRVARLVASRRIVVRLEPY